MYEMQIKQVIGDNVRLARLQMYRTCVHQHGILTGVNFIHLSTLRKLNNVRLPHK